MKELKLCPFCGGKAESYSDKAYHIENGKQTGNEMWFAVCSECSAVCCGRSKEEAIKAWNRRVTDAG